MFARILIANRGEIACRIIRTCRRMGIATVAVYSDADARSPHVDLADEAIRIGAAPASESYLLPDAILHAAQHSGADAVHPGYGFLSERAVFAEMLASNGIAFIGPPPAAIAAMGDKIASKTLAEAAGVSVVPGFLGEVRDADHAADIARSISYPVMLKASAGGGGKGMRVAWDEPELRACYDAVGREALSGFGDARLLIERFVESPRHIEIQLLGDTHGTLLHLGERECSIQRRHQKVVEEAPSPFVTPAMREAMGAQAIALARAVGYYSAGTVEFIAAPDRSFYFLEMNTRLQVEHPVTEAITGLDLVEQMIRVAAGEPLGFAQADVRRDGWAIETRVYAEDPYRGFLPSTGRLARYRPPAASVAGDVTTRVDDGVVEGSAISIFYDPMIAKLTTHAPSREAAIDAQRVALDRFQIDGIAHNLHFLSALMQHPRFRAGRIDTGFIAGEYPDGFEGAPADAALMLRLAALASVLARADAERRGRIDGQLGAPPAVATEWIVTLGGIDRRARIEGERIDIDTASLTVDAHWVPGQTLVDARFDGDPLTIQVERLRGGRWRLMTCGAVHVATVQPPRIAGLARHMLAKPAPDRSRLLLSPMPGLLTLLHVDEGDAVEIGQPLAVVEAMKMENIVRAARRGTVKSISARPGETLARDAVILEID